MRRARVAWLAVPTLALGLLGACSHVPPIQEMSDARQAVQAAREAGAGSYARSALDQAEGRLVKAERAIKSYDYPEARTEALAAREGASAARRLALSLRAAQASLEGADRAGVPVPQARADLGEARRAAAGGRATEATELAERARTAAEADLNQHYLDSARDLLAGLEKRVSAMSPEDLERYSAARAAYHGNEGRRAYESARALDASVPPLRGSRRKGSPAR